MILGVRKLNDNSFKQRLKLLSVAAVFAFSLFGVNSVKAATVEKRNLSSKQKQAKVKLKYPQPNTERVNLLLTKNLLDRNSVNLNLKYSNSLAKTQELIPVFQEFHLAQAASGKASWYGPKFHGRTTASGEKFNQNALTAAHRSLPFGTQVKVTNVNNGRSVVVRINDRGPFVAGRIIDLSAAAARTLGLVQSGVAPVRLQILGK